MRYATLAYGNDARIYRQASMLVVSLLAHAPHPFDIVVITDRPERFAWFGDAIRIRALIPGELAGWRGPDPFSMRQKIEAARAIVPENGALALLDADTLAIADLTSFVAALEHGALLMHKREFELGANPRAGNRKLWASLEGRTFGGWQFEPRDAMWNSGVLALSGSDAGLLDEALALYDAMAPAGIRHFATEQLVVGLVFSRTGRLRPAEPWFLHYWGNKQNFDEEIGRRLEQKTVIDAVDEFRRDPINLPAEVRPGKLEKLQRWMRRW